MLVAGNQTATSMNTRPAPFVTTSRPIAPLVLRAPVKQPRRAPLGQVLVELRELSSGDLLRAVAMRTREDIQLGAILMANGMVSEAGLYRGLSVQYGCEVADFAAHPPDTRLIDQFGVEKCMQLGLVPWKHVGTATVIATSRPEEFARIADQVPKSFGRILLAVAPEREIHNAVLLGRRHVLAHRAESRLGADASCRTWDQGSAARYGAAVLCGLCTALLMAPQATFLVLCLIAIFTLVLNTGFKLATASATFRASRAPTLLFKSQRQRTTPMQLPTMSIMVPLFREREIASRLVLRLGRLNYPRELLDIVLVTEEDDITTKEALRTVNLPAWMRQVYVPRGTLKTKPRALNYALDFCRGSIIGIYDAEDAPEPDQLFKVARRFHDRGDAVACLQGVLDFYNMRANWLSRCFTIEYATWFRVILPGLEKLGLVIPLGGTTLFIRRAALDQIGGWDAHNVTEDADIGIRLARHGLRTELFPSRTEEEANCTLLPWVKQRSRWLKGYAMTWAVHMKSPSKLWRDLGAWRFAGIQLLFLGTLLQFLLAPILWSFWALPLGLPHPVHAVLSPRAVTAITALFLMAEAVSIVIGVYAVSSHRHKGLWVFVPTLNIYFGLGSLAAYKAFWEMVTDPFYWDKTRHGQHQSEEVPQPELEQSQSAPLPVIRPHPT